MSRSRCCPSQSDRNGEITVGYTCFKVRKQRCTLTIFCFCSIFVTDHEIFDFYSWECQHEETSNSDFWEVTTIFGFKRSYIFPLKSRIILKSRPKCFSNKILYSDFCQNQNLISKILKCNKKKKKSYILTYRKVLPIRPGLDKRIFWLLLLTEYLLLCRKKNRTKWVFEYWEKCSKIMILGLFCKKIKNFYFFGIWS